MTAPAPVSISSTQVAVYLTPKEVADLLRVSEKSVYRWAKDDPSMPMLRLGAPCASRGSGSSAGSVTVNRADH